MAHLGHFALYAALFLMPLSGWAMISASDKPSVLFGYTAFPLIQWLSELPAEQKKEYAHLFKDVHEFTANVLLFLIVIHVVAALRHAFVLRDGIMSRMLPRFWRRSASAPHRAFGFGRQRFKFRGSEGCGCDGMERQSSKERGHF